MINTIVYLFFAFVSFGQSEELSKSKLVYRPVEKVKADQFFDYYKNKEGGMDDVTMVAAPKGRSKFSNLHPKFSQSYKDINNSVLDLYFHWDFGIIFQAVKYNF